MPPHRLKNLNKDYLEGNLWAFPIYMGNHIEIESQAKQPFEAEHQRP